MPIINDRSVFVRKEILVGDIETSFLEAGTGEPIVLLHGGEFGGEAEICWEETISALAEHFRVIAPDLLGFGQTAKVVDFVDGRSRRLRHLARFIEQVGAIGAPCIGNSMGGMLLLFDAASETPQLFAEKLVTIAGGGEIADSPYTDSLFNYDGSTQAMRKIVEALFHDRKWIDDPAYIARRRTSSLRPGAWEAIAAARFRRPEDVREVRSPNTIAYSKIKAQTLIIAGAEDKIKPEGWWDELLLQMSDAQLVLVPEAGHCPQIEKPEIVNRALLDFLMT